MLWIVVVFAIVLLVGVNAMSLKSTPKSDEEIAAEKAEANKSDTTASPAAPGDPEQGPPTLSNVSSYQILGKADSQKEVIVGFEWTPAVQADPTKVYNTVQGLTHVVPDARIRVVNVDQAPDIPAGISFGGHVVVPAEEDGSISLRGDTVGMLQKALNAPIGATKLGSLPKVSGDQKAAAGAASAP